jgi:small subunit ribosomal protein S6
MLLREYETIYILRPDLTEDEINGVKEKMANIFSREEGHVLHQDIWGKKKLSYEIKKQPKGIYVHLSYLGGPATTNEIERNLRLLEPVLKYQTLRVAKDVDVERRLAERDAEAQARAVAAARKEAEAKEREEALAQADMNFAEEDAPEATGNNEQAWSPEETSEEKE